MTKLPLLMAVAGCAHISAQTQRPHIILIMTDQQRFDALGCTSGGTVVTPHLDRLAAEGTRFEHAYTSCPSSTPARARLLTGLSPWHHGMLGYGRMSQHPQHELPAMLAGAGYYTFAIGKNHYYPQRARHGYSNVLLDESGRVEDANFVSDYHQWFQLQQPGGNPDATGLGWNDHGAATYRPPERLHPTHWTGLMAREIIDHYDTASGQPLFLKVSFARPHSPYDPPQRFLDLYAGRPMPAPAVGDWCGQYAIRLDPTRAESDAAFGNFGAEYAERSRRHYYANVSFIDEEVGTIITALKARGIYDETLILFLSDHGDMLGDHYHWRKTYPYEGSAHIPLIVKWPKSYGIAPGTADAVAELRDVMPTMLEAAGADAPQDLDGRSLRLPALGQTAGWRQYIDMEHATCYSADNYWTALTDGRMKYIWNLHNGSEQLFDLKRDPMELHNAVADRRHRRTLQAMRQAMARHLQERGEEWVKDDRLQTRRTTLLYSPNYRK